MDSEMHNGHWFSEVESCIDLILATGSRPVPLLWSLTQRLLIRHQKACLEPFSWWRMKPSFAKWLAKSCLVQATVC